MPRRIVIATHNVGKLREFAALLAPLGFEAVSAADLDLPEPTETGATFAENARIKALAAAKTAGMLALADDSGLCVAALNGAPGVFSARYAAGDYPAAFVKIVAAANAAGDRRAHFTCALCLAWPDGASATYIGQAEGSIATAPSGENGFGYDPIFIPRGHERSYAVLGPAVKDRSSHRALAFAQVRDVLVPPEPSPG